MNCSDRNYYEEILDDDRQTVNLQIIHPCRGEVENYFKEKKRQYTI